MANCSYFFYLLVIKINSWLTAIGYSLCYGTILTKLGRVYYIFHNPSVTKKVSSYNKN